MILEVIATNLTDVKDAALYGADRIELSPAMTELGITPSYGLIKEAVHVVNIPINVIVRPHSQSFHYNENDLQTMITDIDMIKNLGANGIVIGPLTAKKTIDEIALERLLAAAGGLDITIHRAFDFARDQMEALNCLKKYSEVTTILTAGGDYAAPDAVDKINQLIKAANNNHLKIMAGHGLRLDNVKQFYQSIEPVDAIHFGTGARINESFAQPLDKEKIKAIKNIIHP